MDKIDIDIMNQFSLREDELDSALESMHRDYAESNKVLN